MSSYLSVCRVQPARGPTTRVWKEKKMGGHVTILSRVFELTISAIADLYAASRSVRANISIIQRR